MDDFRSFLQSTISVPAGGKPLFVPGIYDETGKVVWKELNEPIALSQEAITEAEKRLERSLPGGYKTFLRTLGTGNWAGAFVVAPEHLYLLDEDVGEMCGYIPLACNVNGHGDYVAFNPAAGETIYFLSHDPFGYAVAAQSFEQYIMNLARFRQDNPSRDVREFYESCTPFVEVVLEQPKRTKPWWQFWS